MKNLLLHALLVALAVAPRMEAKPRVAIRVSPAISYAPATLTIQITVEPHDENRMVAIELDSSTYSRTSEIPLDGKNAESTRVINLRGVPSGVYEVRAVLFGTSGPIAQTMQLAKVESAPGSR